MSCDLPERFEPIEDYLDEEGRRHVVLRRVLSTNFIVERFKEAARKESPDDAEVLHERPSRGD